jgi:nicotinic acid mononucleotide adenylyltransferase
MAHERRIVIAFGRFNPPTTGHEAIVAFLTQTARRIGADTRIYPSPSTDAKKNPLPFREKVGFLRQLFPHVTINDNPAINGPFAAFADVSAAGYKDITVIVGADRLSDFEKFAAYLLPASSSKYNAAKHIDATHYHVLAIPRGIGAISATLMRGYVVANDFPSFLAGTPGKNITVAKKIFSSLRQHMRIREQRDYRDKMRQKIQEAGVISSLKKGTYAVVAIENNKVLTNSMAWDLNAKEAQIYANMMRARHPHATISIEAAGGRVSQVLKPGDKVITSMFGEAALVKDAGAAAHAMRGHNRAAEDKYVDQVNDAQTVLYYRKNGGLREDAPMGAPKPPSDVDRLKVRQATDTINLKQRQATELMAAKIRDVETKARAAQTKATAP